MTRMDVARAATKNGTAVATSNDQPKVPNTGHRASGADWTVARSPVVSPAAAAIRYPIAMPISAQKRRGAPFVQTLKPTMIPRVIAATVRFRPPIGCADPKDASKSERSDRNADHHYDKAGDLDREVGP